MIETDIERAMNEIVRDRKALGEFLIEASKTKWESWWKANASAEVRANHLDAWFDGTPLPEDFERILPTGLVNVVLHRAAIQMERDSFTGDFQIILKLFPKLAALTEKDAVEVGLQAKPDADAQIRAVSFIFILRERAIGWCEANWHLLA